MPKIEQMENLLQYGFFQNALLATLMISICCGITGTYIVSRRLVFIGGGISHSSFGGLGIAYWLGLPPLAGAAAGAVLAAIGITRLGKDRKLREDSLIGIFWSAGMAVGLLFINMSPGYVPNLLSFLFGNILTVTDELLVYAAILTSVIVIFFAAVLRPLFYCAFDSDYARTHRIAGTALEYSVMVVIALTIVLCMKLAGIILVISYLTMPQNIAGIFTRDFKRLITLSTCISVAGSAAGLYLSAVFDIPSGAAIVLCFLAILAVCKTVRYAAVCRKSRITS